jgi:radical SAM protein with 4Fe4S-binding SPASM domain
MADNPHAIMIQPDGSFCRCEHENIHDSYGDLDRGVLNPQKLLEWKENIESSEDCAECVLYPSCFRLKHCMNADAPCILSVRLKRLKMYEELFKLKCDKYLEEEKNEDI